MRVRISEEVMRKRARIREQEYRQREEYIEQADRLIQALGNIEGLREQLQDAATHFEELLECFPYIKIRYAEFINLGGVKTRDLARFLNGKVIRHRRYASKKHMRVVSSNPNARAMLRWTPGDEAA